MKKIIQATVQLPDFAGDDRVVTHWPLSTRVLAVAATRTEGTWKAYIDAVPGWNHDNEWQKVLAHGAMLDEPVARLLFGHRPEFGPDVPYAL